jgi:hypothetical protein
VNAFNKTNNPTSHGIKIIVDGPKYGQDTGPGGCDLITSGGCPVQKQDNIFSEWQFRLNAWSFEDMAPALKAIKNCNRDVSKRVFETTGGSIRLALTCVLDNGTLNVDKLKHVQEWMEAIAQKHASKPTIQMAYYSSELSADPNSLDRLRSMIVKEDEISQTRSTWQHFETYMLLASPYVARLLQSKLMVDDMLKALSFARNSGIGSLYGWQFGLWAHKITEIAIDKWCQEEKKVVAERCKGRRGKNLGHVQGEVTGKESVKFLTVPWRYWKPSIPNFANIDAAILLDDGMLLCLLFTVDTTHGFNIKTFKSDFLDQIPEDVRSTVKKIFVKFVIPMDKGSFSSIRVPVTQEPIYMKVVDNEVGSPIVHFVRPKQTTVSTIVAASMVPENQNTDEERQDTIEDSSMDTGRMQYTEYDEDLDYEYCHDDGIEQLEQSEWDLGEVKIVFQWMAVDPANVQKNASPFFDIPKVE